MAVPGKRYCQYVSDIVFRVNPLIGDNARFLHFLTQLKLCVEMLRSRVTYVVLCKSNGTVIVCLDYDGNSTLSDLWPEIFGQVTEVHGLQCSIELSLVLGFRS